MMQRSCCTEHRIWPYKGMVRLVTFFFPVLFWIAHCIIFSNFFTKNKLMHGRAPSSNIFLLHSPWDICCLIRWVLQEIEGVSSSAFGKCLSHGNTERQVAVFLSMKPTSLKMSSLKVHFHVSEKFLAKSHVGVTGGVAMNDMARIFRKKRFWINSSLHHHVHVL